MVGLTVLSPHYDDAVFSLFLSLSKWTATGLRITVINFFTNSAYAPQAPKSSPFSVSEIRRREDVRAVSRVSTDVRIRSLGLLDAPLRLSLDFRELFRPENATLLSFSFIDNLAQQIAHFSRGGLLLSPLGLGNHVDHLAVRQAALAASHNKRVSFYEDLPYAIWTDENSLRQKISEIAGELNTRFEPRVIRSSSAFVRKRAAAATYSSQITREEASSIARFSAKYGGGERIWVPFAASSWTSMLSDHR